MSSNNNFQYTVIIPTFNESDNIDLCLRSIVGVNEIIIVDSFSTDNTCDKARKFNVKILQNEFFSHGEQINWSLEYATNDWVFVLDADERFNPGLVDELNMLSPESDKDTFSVKRVNYFLGKQIRYGLWSKDLPVRLFNKKHNFYNVQRVHSSVSSNGLIRKLNSTVSHYSYNSIDDYLKKLKRFSTGGSIDLHEKGRRFSILSCLSRSIFRFVKGYLMYSGYKDGIHGMLVATLEAIYVFLKYMKLWEIQTGRKSTTQGISRL